MSEAMGAAGAAGNGAAAAAEIDVQLRTANRDRKADLGVSPDVRVEELLHSARENWALPGQYEYILRSERLGRQLRPNETLGAAGIVAGDILEIQQISDAGSRRARIVVDWRS